MNKVKAISSWSGGKDSCLACYKAIAQGYKITHLLNFISRESKRGCFHGLQGDLLKFQAKLIDIPIVQKEVSPDMEKYEDEFKAAVSEFKLKGTDAMVFGDIYLEEHKNWISRVCNDLNIASVQPLWNSSPLHLMEEFIGLGFKAIIISCKADILGSEFLGRQIDYDLIHQFKDMGICPCGEHGEFHTLVVDGPLFEKRIEILETRIEFKEGFWKYWFLDIKKYE
jgi:uncharacterized protein (TIGR00290 family)